MSWICNLPYAKYCMKVIIEVQICYFSVPNFVNPLVPGVHQKVTHT